VLIGFLLASAGATLFVDRAGGAGRSAELISRWWPAAVIAVLGLCAASFAGRPFRTWTGRALPLAVLTGLLLVVGIVLAATAGWLPDKAGRYVLPLVLIGAGAATVLFQPVSRERHATWLSTSAVLTRVRVRSNARGIRQITARAVLGQVAIDLTGATLAGAPEVHATVFGGSVWLRLPVGWTVTVADPAGSDLDVVVPAAPDGALPARSTTLELRLLGLRGRLIVEWGQAPAHLRAPGSDPSGV
jgi:hypothetical protein